MWFIILCYDWIFYTHGFLILKFRLLILSGHILIMKLLSVLTLLEKKTSCSIYLEH
jgi:hypothetical protein